MTRLLRVMMVPLMKFLGHNSRQVTIVTTICEKNICFQNYNVVHLIITISSLYIKYFMYKQL